MPDNKGRPSTAQLGVMLAFDVFLGTEELTLDVSA
jgi:hypothetical protein